MLLGYTTIFSFYLCSFASGHVTHQFSQQVVEQLQKTPYATYSDSCGGYIEAKRDQLIVLEYKLNEEYDNDEFCIWEIRKGESDNVLFTKLRSGFEDGLDFIQISGLRSTDNPPSMNRMGGISGIEQAHTNGAVNFVIFYSDHFNTGTGFRIEIVGYHPLSYRRDYDDFLSFSPVGTTTLRPYLPWMIQSFLITPRHKTVESLVLDLDFVTRAPSDYIAVYTLEVNGGAINFRQHDNRVSGNGSRSYDTEYYTNFLVLFYSDGFTIPEGAGIDLRWCSTVSGN